MENQAYHIQLLLADELDRYKEKENSYTDNHIKEIQDEYKIEQPDEEQLMIVNKGKKKENWVQEEEVFLYIYYDTLSKSSKPKTLELTFI